MLKNYLKIGSEVQHFGELSLTDCGQPLARGLRGVSLEYTFSARACHIHALNQASISQLLAWEQQSQCGHSAQGACANMTHFLDNLSLTGY